MHYYCINVLLLLYDYYFSTCLSVVEHNCWSYNVSVDHGTSHFGKANSVWWCDGVVLVPYCSIFSHIVWCDGVVLVPYCSIFSHIVWCDGVVLVPYCRHILTYSVVWCGGADMFSHIVWCGVVVQTCSHK